MNSNALGLHNIAGSTSQSQTGKKVTGFTFGKYSVEVNSTDAFSDQKLSAIAGLKDAVSQAASAKGYMMQIDLDGKGSAYYIGTQLSTDGTNIRYSTASAAMEADLSVMKAAISDGITDHGATYAKTENVIAKQTTVGQATTLTDPSVKDYASANATIDAVQKAINQVSSQRSALGALQNRLEHTVSNLDNVSENTSSAESRIRDTDMASEMVTYSKNNILAQAGQSMLAQANQSTQGVLSLLQ